MELPKEYRIMRNITGDPLAGMPFIDYSYISDFVPTGWYTDEVLSTTGTMRISCCWKSRNSFITSCVFTIRCLRGTIVNEKASARTSSLLSSFLLSCICLGPSGICLCLLGYTTSTVRSIERRLHVGFMNPPMLRIEVAGFQWLRKWANCALSRLV